MIGLGGETGTSRPTIRERAIVLQGFWRSQWTGEATRTQRWFDLVAGILLPVLCVTFDPIVFKGDFPAPLLAGYRAFAYVAIALGVTGLALWLAFGRRMPASVATLQGGIFAAGALFATALGTVMLPVSLIGLAILIGFLGFSPFVVALVFARNAARAITCGRRRLAAVWSAALILLGAAGAVGVPWVAQREAVRLVERSVPILASDGAEASSRAIFVLRWVRFVVDTDPIVWKYVDETDPIRKMRLAEAFQRITGQTVDDRLIVLAD